MILRALLAIFAILLPATLLAHSDHPAKHGGKTANAGPYVLELVTGGGQLKVFVYNDKTEKPENITAAKGTATVLLGQQREVVQLQPDAAGKDGNLMTGNLTLAQGPGMRVVVQVQFPGKPTIVARFTF
ncbi:MAG: hypothetical protein EXQ95_09365 [Alphaproteobacteria bacterium]|nr:hypothetical protein [Alphaproteobacteria bacterium]